MYTESKEKPESDSLYVYTYLANEADSDLANKDFESRLYNIFLCNLNSPCDLMKNMTSETTNKF